MGKALDTWVGLGFALLVGCGSGDDGGTLSGAPDCADPEFRLIGTLDGSAVDEVKSSGVRVVIANIGDPYFEVSYQDPSGPASNPFELRLTWQDTLANGRGDAATGETLVPAAGHPRAGETLCVTDAEVGFMKDGEFRFRIDGLREGADCSGADVPVALLGCSD